jgi:hypothetical protein
MNKRRKIISYIPNSLWCKSIHPDYTCRFYGEQSEEHLDTCFSYCTLYRTVWLNSTTHPQKLMRCYYDDDKAQIRSKLKE